MNRRNFLSRLGFGTAAVAATAVVPSAVTPAPQPPQASLRPKCPMCGTLMLVRQQFDNVLGSYTPDTTLRMTVKDSVLAYCPNTKCVAYGEKCGFIPVKDGGTKKS